MRQNQARGAKEDAKSLGGRPANGIEERDFMIPKVTEQYLANGANKGNRNDALMDAACQLRDDGWTLDQATQTLLPRARADGLFEAEIRATLRSVFNRPRREPCGGGHNHFSMYNGGATKEKPVSYYKTPVQPEPLPSPIDDGAINFLKAKFRPGEFVSIGEGYASQKNGEITMAINEGVSRTLETWIADIEMRGLDGVFPNALDGLFVRVNPMTNGNGKSDGDVACFRDALVEADEGELEKQFGAIRKIELPIPCIGFSADRSVQAHVRIDAPDKETYRERFGILRQFCVESLGLKMDEKNINPSRYSRLPGGRRTRRDHDTKEKIPDANGDPIIDRQTLLAVNLTGKPWEQWVEGLPIDDGLPAIESPDQFLARRMQLDPFLIDGLLREKSKMNFTSQSKGRKTWLQIHQALCIGSGTPWLGHQCTRAPVLYVNLELKASTLNNRALDICEVMGIDPVNGHDVDFWNLRGKSADIAVMVDRILKKIPRRKYKVAYLDPGYKCLGWRDENSARDITNFMNEIERIAEEGGASICVTGHTPKGDMSKRNANDLQSGSGVWSRDPDVVASFLDCEDQDILSVHGENCITVKFSGMREDPTPKPFAAKWEYPIFQRINTEVEVKKGGRQTKYTPKQLMDILGNQKIKRSKWAKIASEKIGVSRSIAYDLMRELEAQHKVFENIDGEMERAATK